MQSLSPNAEDHHLLESALIVVSAKHGQSPIDRQKLAMESGGHGTASVTDPLDQVFAAFVNPNDGSSPVVKGHLQTDDVGLLWLQDQSRSNIEGVVTQLTDSANRAAMFATDLPPGSIFDSNINYGDELAIYGVLRKAQRRPPGLAARHAGARRPTALPHSRVGSLDIEPYTSRKPRQKESTGCVSLMKISEGGRSSARMGAP